MAQFSRQRHDTHPVSHRHPDRPPTKPLGAGQRNRHARLFVTGTVSPRSRNRLVGGGIRRHWRTFWRTRRPCGRIRCRHARTLGKPVGQFSWRYRQLRQLHLQSSTRTGAYPRHHRRSHRGCRSSSRTFGCGALPRQGFARRVAATASIGATHCRGVGS